MGASLWPRVVDALVDGCRRRPGYRAPDEARDGVTVYDGPQALLSAERTPAYLIIGWPGGADGDPREEDSGTCEVTPAALGSAPRPREETGQVRCLAVLQSGDSTPGAVRTARHGALAVLEDVELLLVDPTLGIVPGAGQMRWARLGPQSRWAQYAAGGCVCEIAFTVQYAARI
jgi:hypothetical protein